MATATPTAPAVFDAQIDEALRRVRALQADARTDYAGHRDSGPAARDNLGFARAAAKLVRS